MIYLFNPSTGLWISYNDLEIINLKNNYIKQNRLGRAFFWNFLLDRQDEFIRATFNSLYQDIHSSTANCSLLISTSINLWIVQNQYKVNQRVMYQNKSYRCIKTHQSTLKETSDVYSSLWQLETTTIIITTMKKMNEFT
ncbi:unnamed protein product [Adineta ricciae]|uniref:GH18 domain-containing protein n=1 Tax=Adineta ricciae TaxID=249248 RepID=A0A815PW04_ADIRI|nr:unnamed protein product [Adineta ricciae]CAF1649472.1 unnamed protein product [Adineta ricciae]